MVSVGTLLIQGWTLPLLIGRLQLSRSPTTTPPTEPRTRQGRAGRARRRRRGAGRVPGQSAGRHWTPRALAEIRTDHRPAFAGRRRDARPGGAHASARRCSRRSTARCWPRSGRRSSPNATRAASRTKRCGPCSSGSTCRRPGCRRGWRAGSETDELEAEQDQNRRRSRRRRSRRRRSRRRPSRRHRRRPAAVPAAAVVAAAVPAAAVAAAAVAAAAVTALVQAVLDSRRRSPLETLCAVVDSVHAGEHRVEQQHRPEAPGAGHQRRLPPRLGVPARGDRAARRRGRRGSSSGCAPTASATPRSRGPRTRSAGPRSPRPPTAARSAISSSGPGSMPIATRAART